MSSAIGRSFVIAYRTMTKSKSDSDWTADLTGVYAIGKNHAPGMDDRCRTSGGRFEVGIRLRLSTP